MERGSAGGAHAPEPFSATPLRRDVQARALRTPLNAPGHWDVMISYVQCNPKSESLALHLREELEKRGKSVWLDVKMADKAEAAMEEAVINSRCVLAIVSGPVAGEGDDTAYFSCPFCLKELRWTVKARVFIQPVVTAEDKPKISEFTQSLPGDLTHLSRVDWYDINSSGIEYLEVGVNKILRGNHWTAEPESEPEEQDDPFGDSSGSPGGSPGGERRTESLDESLRSTSSALTVYYRQSQAVQDPSSLAELAFVARRPEAELAAYSQEQFERTLQHLCDEKLISPLCMAPLTTLQTKVRTAQEEKEAGAAELKRQVSLETAVKLKFNNFMDRVGGAQALEGLDKTPVSSLAVAVDYIEGPGTPDKTVLKQAVQRAYDFADELLRKGPDPNGLTRDEIAVIHLCENTSNPHQLDFQENL